MKYRFISISALLATGASSVSVPADPSSTQILSPSLGSLLTSEHTQIISPKFLLPLGTNFTFPVKKIPTQIQKRGTGGTIEVPLWKDGLRGYDARISVGGQEMDILVDTGSDTVWVIGSHANAPHGKSRGTYDSSRSQTGRVVAPGGFAIRYGDKTGAAGDVIQDTLGLGGARISNFQLNVASDVYDAPNTASMRTGTMGLGYSTTGRPPLPEAMAAQGIINSPAFSAWLNAQDNGNGNILFGGIDTEKFHGPLASLSMYPRDKSPVSFPEYIVSFTSFGVTSSKGTNHMTFPGRAALLDTGHSLTILPDELANVVYDALGTYWNPSMNEATVPCSSRNIEGSFDFGFGGPSGPIIRVPYRELIVQSGNTCEVGVKPESLVPSHLPLILGDAFLRSAYVVHDMPNYRIGLAQAKMNAKNSKIVKFPSWGAPIPHAKIVQNETPVGRGSPSRTWIPAGEGYPAFGGDEEAPVQEKLPVHKKVTADEKLPIEENVQVPEKKVSDESAPVEKTAPGVEEKFQPVATNGTIEYSATEDTPMTSTSDTPDLTLDEEEALSSPTQAAKTTPTDSMTTAIKPSSTGTSTTVDPETYPTEYATSGSAETRVNLRGIDIFGAVVTLCIFRFLF